MIQHLLKAFRVLRNVAFLAALTLAWSGSASGEAANRAGLLIDEGVWVLFYDLPTRRFGQVRDAFLRGDFEAARRDLVIGSQHLRIEAAQAQEELRQPLLDAAEALDEIASSIDAQAVTIERLLDAFARSHWRLAQHYALLARRARDRANLSEPLPVAAGVRNPAPTADVLLGRYLVASVHHVERAVRSSNHRISARDIRVLDDVRAAALRLSNGNAWAELRSRRPLTNLEALIERVGKQIGRPVFPGF